MNRLLAWLVIGVVAVSLDAQAPEGHPAPDAALTEAVAKALPKGITESGEPLKIIFPPIGKIRVVMYRGSITDRAFHGMVMISVGNLWGSAPLPDAPIAPTEEQISTAVFSAKLKPSGSALVVLYYTRRPGLSESEALGRAYVYQSGVFTIDEAKSHKLDGVRTVAVARMRLLGETP